MGHRGRRVRRRRVRHRRRGHGEARADGSVGWSVGGVQGKDVAAGPGGLVYVVSDGFPGTPAGKSTTALTPQGTVAWQNADAAGAAAVGGGLLLTVEPATVAPECVASKCGATSLFGYRVRAYDPSGALVYGFFDEVGAGLAGAHPIAQDVSIADGRLALTAPGWETRVYQMPIVHACAPPTEAPAAPGPHTGVDTVVACAFA